MGADDLRLPVTLYTAWKDCLDDSAMKRELDEVSQLLHAGDCSAAKVLLAKYYN